MTTMIDDAVAKCRAGITSAAEVLRVTDGAVRPVPNFRYRALTQSGEMVSGSICGADAPRRSRAASSISASCRSTPSPTSGAGRFALQLLARAAARRRRDDLHARPSAAAASAGARLDDALELLSTDIDIGRLRPTVGKIRASVLSGESFADALAHHPSLFPPMYVALVRVGEASGTLDHILEVLADERARAEALRRKLGDALRYPAFVLFARRLRAGLLPGVRAAAIRRGAARLRRQARSDGGACSSACRISCAQLRHGARHRGRRAAACRLAAAAPAERARACSRRSRGCR